MPAKRRKKYDPALYLVLAVFFVASVLYAVFPSRNGDLLTVEVVLDGQIIMSGNLGEIDFSTMTFSEHGFFNEIAIGEGIRMVSANCPGGDCIKAGEIKKNGEIIACVPHRLLIRLVSSQRPEVDAVSR